MNTKPCVFCGKAATQVEGRKPRKYCSNSCRQKHWQSQNKDKPSTVKETKIDPATIVNRIEIFMGHDVPEGLKGIDLSIWKAEIKEKVKNV